MPKPRKEENPDALGQIFDFIFKEAEKPPDKRKPVKVTGISGQNELTDALAAALEKPGVYLTDQALDTLNNALDVEVARIKTDEGDSKIKFTTNNLLSIVDNPNEFIDKGYIKAKEARKQMRVQYLGKMMQHFVAEGWAKKYNLDLDAREAIRGSFEARHLDRSLSKEERAKSYSSSNAMGAAVEGRFYKSALGNQEFFLGSEQEHLASRSAELLGREVFGRDYWGKLSGNQKKGFLAAYQSGKSNIVENYLQKNFDGAYGEKFKSRYTALLDDLKEMEIKKLDIWDRDTYLKLEERNLDFRIKELNRYKEENLLQGRQLTNVETGINRLEQAKVIVGGNMLDLETVAKARISIDKAIFDYREKISQARISGDRETIRLYQKQIRDLRAGNRELSSIMLWGRIGQIDGYISSFKSIYADGNFVRSFLDGTFFDPSSNSLLRPTDRKGAVDFGKGGSLKVLIAAESKNKLVQKYNNVVAPLYYLTPKSLINSFFINGEGFVFLTYMMQKKLEKALNGGMINIEQLLSSDPEAYLRSILANPNSDLIRSMKNVKSMAGFAKTFSFGQRMKDKIKKYFDDKVFKQLRQRIYDSLIKKATQEIAVVLGQWLANGGIQTFVKGLVMIIANALGFATTGGLANFVITVVAALLVDVLYGIIKVIAMVVIFAFIGIFALVFMLGSKSTYKHAQNSYAYTTVVPGEVITNPNFKGLYPIDGDETLDGLHPFSGGSLPDGVQCLIGTGRFVCTQGPFSSFSHSKVAAIDIGGGVRTFYAPTFCDGSNCVVKTVAEVNCTRCDIPSMPGCHQFPAGGMVIFDATYGSTTYTFKLIHVYKDVSVGQELSSGEAVADIIQNGPDHQRIEMCSSGSHLHLEVKANGNSVNPMDVMTGATSSGGFACNISSCSVD